MDVGDLIRLIFFAIIFLSFFGGLFNRKNSDEKQPPVRPTDLSQSGGPDRPRPTPPAQQSPGPASHEQRWEAQTLAHPERHQEEVRERYRSSRDATYDDAIESGDVTRLEAPREELRERLGQRQDQSNAQLAREEALERGPSAGSQVTGDGARAPRLRRRPVVARRKHPATGGDVLRRSLKEPDTLERAFIVKEVLDLPVGLRQDR